MEAALVIIALLALIGGSAVVLSRQGLLPRTIPLLRMSEGDAEPLPSLDDGTGDGSEPRREPTLLAATSPPKPALVKTQPTESEPTAEPVRLDLVPATADLAHARLDRIEAQLDDLRRAVASRNDHLADEARRIHAELVLRAEAEEARRDGAHERLRADVLALMSRAMAERQVGTSVRRMEVSAELYAQLAQFEAALATVTNPILLPGEPFAPPAELLPEALVWENWNEVGERAFALAETYSAQRLHLSAQTRSDVGAFVTTLRTLLTRSVYPNLQAEADTTHQSALRAALSEIATELPRIREVLETEYLEGKSA